ncbi:uncharacterized protein LOC125761912 [Anopheles funestus]|uniref:uncharacterized protein LOC125761912 n=1 Tax=Anopheles funestus TaxID=62324 RepID=UPI0020C67F68|nr:uncharacterized protein LOC125761912 [Anopheles funestus]
MVRGECIRAEYSSPECPPGTVITDGRCVRSATCAPGYQLRGNLCVKQRVVKLTCARGFLQDGNCVAPGPNCPVDYEMRRDGCIRRETSQPSCPQGGNLQDNYCVIGRPRCSDDYRYAYGRCTKVSKVRAQCRGTAVLKDGMCVTKVTSSTPYCSNGYTLQGGMCVRTIYAQATCTSTASSISSSSNVASGATTSTIHSSNIVASAPTVVIDTIPSYSQIVSIDSGSSIAKSSNVVTTYHEERSGTSNFDDYITGDNDVAIGVGAYEEYPTYSSSNSYSSSKIDSYSNSNLDTYTSSNVDTNDVTSSYDFEVTVPKKSEDASGTATEVVREKRCTVVGPRVCMNYGGSWSCEQHQYHDIASSYCESESTVIQLVANHHIAYNGTVFVMAPNEAEDEGYDESYDEDEELEGSTLDCSQCEDESYSCSKRCFTYDQCDSCTTIKLEQFCMTANSSMMCQYTKMGR